MKISLASFPLMGALSITILISSSMLVVGQSGDSIMPTSKTTSTHNIDVDGDGTFDALTDGLLLLRHMFGLSGEALIAGVVSDSATYTTSAELVSRMSDLGDTLDIDSNGQIDALTDGLIILRYLFGLDGEVLIANVIGSGAERYSTNAIKQHLSQLTTIDIEEIIQPNIILIISDDQGLDSSAQYNFSNNPPVTPTLN